MRMRLASLAVAFLGAVVGLTLVLMIELTARARQQDGQAGELPVVAEITGRLDAVNLSLRVVTVTFEAGTVRLAVPGTASVFCNGRLGRLSDLRVGQSVKASYEAGAGHPVALWIELIP